MIRRLDPEKDIELYRQCWGWREQYPRSLREAVKVGSVETFEEFLDLARGARADVGVFDEELITLVSIDWKADGVYEIGFSAKRGAGLKRTIEPCLSILKTIFEDLQARFIFAFTPEWNRGAKLLMAAMGMKLDGVSRLHGVSHERVIRWQRLSMTKADYESNRQTATDADGNGTVHAGRIVDYDLDTCSEYSRHRAA